MKDWVFHLSMFVVGLRDSLSLNWIRKLLLATHPTTKKIHPSSYKLLNTFKDTFVQVFIFLISIPAFFRYINQDQIAFILGTLFLLLTYGYLFFYNTEVISSTKQLALWWAQKFPSIDKSFPPMDVREKSELFYGLSNTVKSFVFLLLYYTPIFLSCLILTSIFPVIGTFFLVISESFFNSTFYFLKKWPYDRYNIAFLEKNIAYMLGYGFTVSFITNVVFTGDMARGLYFIISQWMIINAVLFSPPDLIPHYKENCGPDSAVKFLESMIQGSNRAKLGNKYNTHREMIRSDKKYRHELINQMVLMKPALKITELLNSMLASVFQKNTKNIS